MMPRLAQKNNVDRMIVQLEQQAVELDGDNERMFMLPNERTQPTGFACR